ncbi:MAG: penicillin-binding transpeptidase domain-containing protein, partial [Rikenellaceae bacterium]
SQLKIALEDIKYNETIKDLFKDRDYTIAGKMGTAMVSVDGQYVSDAGRQYLASFVGYFPADNPKYSCIVQIKTFKPNSEIKPYQGGVLAGPVFRDIADYMTNSQVH